MKKRKVAAALLALAVLAGCAAQGPEGKAGEEDIVYQVLGVSRDTAVATVDGVDVDTERYLYWLMSSIEMQMYYGLSMEEDWTQEYQEGQTIAGAIKADALETMKLFQVVENKALELGAALTPEQEEALAAETQEMVEQAGGEEVFQARLNKLGISREGFTALNRVKYLNQALKEKLTQTGELTITQEEREELAREGGYYAAKHILVSTRRNKEDGSGYEDFSDEEKAQALEKASGLYQQIMDASGQEREETFDRLMKEHSEDGRDPETGELYYPQGYTCVEPGRMVPEFEAGALALEIGGVSQPIQTDYGYHIILRIPVDQEELKKIYNEDYKLNLLARKWVEEAQVTTTKLYDDLDPKAVYEKLQKVVEAKTSQEQESGEPGGSPAE